MKFLFIIDRVFLIRPDMENDRVRELYPVPDQVRNDQGIRQSRIGPPASQFLKNELTPPRRKAGRSSQIF